ncbi:MAG: hypothetical protein M3463_16915 [Verrucomicrobiota bacterium]|nr:hypothetical protein [Verrucomicrobiota bacterium]
MFRKIYPPLAAVLALVFLVSLIMWIVKAEGPGKLTWAITVKPTVMTVAYKAYANPNAGGGRFYLSKLVLKNTGKGSLRNISISSQIPGYVPWTTPEIYPEMLPGQTIVKLFYPKFPATISQTTSTTTAELETRLAWDDRGKQREQVLRNNFDIRSLNEVEWTSMPASEALTWFDMYENSALCAAYVTNDDPVVKRFAAAVMKYSGGTNANFGGGPEETVRLMKAFYEYQVLTGMRYSGAQGVPQAIGDVRSVVQNVRLPRDVIQTGTGLCVELAILWAAVMEHLGVETRIACIPGHALPLVVANGQEIPIESTGIGAGTSRPLTFEEAVKSGQETMQKTGNTVIRVPVHKLQIEGIRPPELPPVDMKDIQDIINSREQTATRRAQAAGGQGAPANQQGGQAAAETTPPKGFVNYTDPSGNFAFAMPETWKSSEQTVAAMRASAPWFIYTAGDLNTGQAVEIYHWPNLASIPDAIADMGRSARALGIQMTADSSNAVEYGGRLAARVIGRTQGRAGMIGWTSLWVQTPQNGVLSIVASAPANHFNSQRPMLESVTGSFRFR